jgi:hypothetical protein
MDSGPEPRASGITRKTILVTSQPNLDTLDERANDVSTAMPVRICKDVGPAVTAFALNMLLTFKQPPAHQMEPAIL